MNENKIYSVIAVENSYDDIRGYVEVHVDHEGLVKLYTEDNGDSGVIVRLSPDETLTLIAKLIDARMIAQGYEQYKDQK